MIPVTFIDKELANSSQNPYADTASTAIVCRIEPGTLELDVLSQFNSDPSQELLDKTFEETTGKSQPVAPEFQEWTPALEAKFRRLTEDKALKRLSLKAKVEFERLAAVRRRLHNPRSGEEVMAEYEQRMLTRNLVSALTQYVEFHNMPHHKR